RYSDIRQLHLPGAVIMMITAPMPDPAAGHQKYPSSMIKIANEARNNIIGLYLKRTDMVNG
ncbi:hypothetical protein, partial [Niveispirillum sp.]|uniref:hypothetical protein n=1 Tax=Niveispirillum sp. TaxID=1917217 RepID=UPI001B427DB8